MRPLRIQFVTATLGVGGAERQWATLIPQLRQQGFEPSVLTLYGSGPVAEELHRTEVPTASAGISDRNDLVGIARTAARAPAGDLVVSLSFAGHVVAHCIATRARVPHVTAEHHGHGLPRRRHERALLHLFSPRVTAVVAVSASQIPDLVDVGFRRNRIRIIPNGIGALVTQRTREQVREELGLTGDTFVAVLAARLRPEKQAHVFVEAVARAHAANDRVRGLIAGGGPELQRIEELARATGGTVRALGYRSDVVDVLGAADAVCLSSDAEALPLVILEAMALGKPVVATDVGGIRDAVAHNETGLLVGPGDAEGMAKALEGLAADPGLTVRLGERARQVQATRFSLERMVDDYARLFQSVAART